MIWNKQALLKRVRNREDRAKILIDMYFEDIPERLKHLSDNMEKEDFLSASKVAHAIKGIVANLGGEACQRSAADIETHGKNANAHECTEAFNTLAVDIKDFDLALQEYLAS